MLIGSLCSGYGGLDIAVEHHFGAHTAWVADNDKDASAVLRARFPHASNLGDIREIEWDSSLAVDILVAGYPCQPFSSAGKQRGTEDRRHLWPHVIRAIRALRPKCVVLENVRGHLAPRMGFGTVLGDLAESGFDADWLVVRASDVGAPHLRARVFVLAALADGPAVRGVAPSDSHKERWQRMAGRWATGGVTVSAPLDPADPWGRYEQPMKRWADVVGRAAPRSLNAAGHLSAEFTEWLMGLPEGWVTEVLPHRKAIKVLGNGVVPQQAQLALRLMSTPETEGTPC